MKKLFFLVLFMVVALFSCVKQEFKPQKPNNPIDYITDSTYTDTTVTLENTVWVIKKILNTNYNEELRNDTLKFISYNKYKFNNVESTYHIYRNSFGYTLVLNNTTWGHLSGTIYDYNFTQGIVENTEFKNYYNNSFSIRLWIYKQ